MSSKQSSQKLENKVLKKEDSAETAPKQRAESAHMLTRSDIMVLQRTMGNSGMTQLLRSQPHAGSSDKSASNYPIQRKFPKNPFKRSRNSRPAQNQPAAAAEQAVAGPERAPKEKGIDKFGKFVGTLEGHNITPQWISDKTSKLDAADLGNDVLSGIKDGILSTASKGAGGGTASKVIDDVSEGLGAVSAGFSTITGGIRTCGRVLKLINPKHKNTKGDWINLVKEGLGTFKSFLDTLKGFVGSFTAILDGFQLASTLLVGIGDAISILTAAIDTVIKVIDIIQRGYAVLKAFLAQDKVRKTTMKHAQVSALFATLGATPEEEKQFLSKKKVGGIKNRLGLKTEFLPAKELEAQGDPQKAAAVEKLKYHIADIELISINKKRGKRQAVPIAADLGDILADVTTMGTKTTALIATVAGSAAAGIGAGAGGAISLGGSVTSLALKTSGTVAKGVAWLSRTVKQAARDGVHDSVSLPGVNVPMRVDITVPHTNQAKTSEQKQDHRVFVVQQLLTQAQNLPPYDRENPEPYRPLYTRFKAIGYEPKRFNKYTARGEEGLQKQLNMLVKGMAQRE